MRTALVVAAIFFVSACGASSTSFEEDGGEDSGVPSANVDGGVGADGGSTNGCIPLHGTGTSLATGLPGARRLAADDTHLYVIATGSLSESKGLLARIPLAGGLLEPWVQDFRAPDALAVTQTDVFVLDSQGLWRISKADAGASKVRIDTTLNNAAFGETELLVDGDSLVMSTGLRWLVRVKQDGSGTQQVFVGEPGSSVRGLARVADDLYFLVAQGSQPGLYKMPIDGSAQPERVRTEPADGHALLLDGDRLIWSEGGGGGSGGIVAAPLDGSATMVLAEGLDSPRRMAKVGEALYFKQAVSGLTPQFFKAIGSCGAMEVGPLGMGPGDLLVRDGVLFFTSEELSGNGYVSRLP